MLGCKEKHDLTYVFLWHVEILSLQHTYIFFPHVTEAFL